MPIDGMVVRAAAAEVAQAVTGSKISAIYQDDEFTLSIWARRPQAAVEVLVSIAPYAPTVHLLDRKLPHRAVPTSFCMGLRKHLEDGIIQGVEQAGLERVVVFRVRPAVAGGGERKLVIELMERRSNIVLVSADGNIIDAMKKVRADVNRYREIMPGASYVPPPPPAKADPLATDRNGFLAALTAAAGRLERWLVDAFFGVSPLVAAEVTARADLEPACLARNLSPGQKDELWQAFSDLMGAMRRGEFAPAVALDRQSKVAVAVTAFRPTRLDAEIVPCPTMSRALDLYYISRTQLQRAQALRQRLRRTLRPAAARLERALHAQEEDLREAREAERYRVAGELILANLHLPQMRRGADRVELPNYYDPHGGTMVLELDPALSPVDNARRCFRKYARAKSALKALGPRIAKTKEELAYLRRVEKALEDAPSLDRLESLETELAAAGYLKPSPKPAAKAARVPVSGAPLRFVSSDGFEIIVGRNARQNDLIVTRLARPEDIWLHAREIPGSHVLVRAREGEPPPERTIREAACLAAYYSRARMSSKVPVDYVRAASVRRPPRAPAGRVVYEGHSTVFVSPDEETVRSLT